MMTREPAEGVLDLHVPLEQTPELERAEVHVPDAVVDFLQADVFTDADGGDVDPSPVPANAAMGAAVAHFEPCRVRARRLLRPASARPAGSGAPSSQTSGSARRSSAGRSPPSARSCPSSARGTAGRRAARSR